MPQAATFPSPAPLPAASLIILRQQRDRLEVLVGRRAFDARAFPGATVFPGGKLEAQDGEADATGDDRWRVAAHAALRETFEETGLLICEGGEGPPPGADIAAAREAVEGGALVFADLVRRWGRRLDPTRATPFAHWITPKAAPYRFDTLFLLVAASPFEAQAPLLWAEFDQLEWAEPARVLVEDGRRLVTPTRHCLTVLSQSETVTHAIETARARGVIDGYAVRAEG